MSTGLLAKLFNSEAKGIVDSIGGVVDNIATSNEEKLKLKNELSSIVLNGINKLTEQQKEVLVTELTGNKLQRNWRPIVMLAFAGIVVSVLFLLPIIDIWVDNPDLTKFISDFQSADNFWGLLKIGLGGYVIGRSTEKITDSVTKNADLSFLKRKDRKDEIK